VPANIRVTVTPPIGASYNYDFANTLFATVNFDALGMTVGIYDVSVTVHDSNGAQTTASIGSFEVKAQTAPKIVSDSISPSKVTLGDVVFITVGCEDAEDGVPANITIAVIAPSGLATSQVFVNVAFASLTFDTSNKTDGIYQVLVTTKDHMGATTTATIGYFEVTPVAAEFPYREATFGIGIAGLIVLLIAALLLFMRLPAKPKPTPPTPTPAPT
jgi:hypothetical protein